MTDPAVRARTPGWTLVVLALADALFGAAYGAQAVAGGSGITLPVLTSLLVQGGASQVASASVLAGHGAPILAIGLGLLLNLRFLGLAMLIGPDLPGRTPAARLLASYLISDIPVGIALLEADPVGRRRLFARVGLVAALAWVLGTAAGAVLGSAIDVTELGVDGAIAGAFVALTAAQLQDARTIVIAAIVLCSTLAAMTVLPSGVAILVGAAVGLVLAVGGAETEPTA